MASSFVLVILSAIFTIGLTFATVELPTVIDRAVQDSVTTPGFDSHADAVARIKTELFIAHYHLRTVGYLSFVALLGLICVGFATRRSGLAVLGGLAFMLPVFAQFAGVMFFLAGLGLLNVVWLPILDVSFDLARLGLVIRAPYDLSQWLLGLAGVNGYWLVVVFFVAAGLLIFFLGTLAWLSARVGGRAVAESWVYRLSRHPQYLGWMLWSYGVFLLLERGHYPRRSWGISASLPLLLSTMVIVAVALLEELHMRRRHGEAYERYRRSAPFLLPMPAVVGRFFALPFRLLFGKERPDRAGEVVTVVALYTALLAGASALFYGDAGAGLIARVAPLARQEARVERLVAQLRAESNPRRRSTLAERIARSGRAAAEPMLALLQDEDAQLRTLAAGKMAEVRSERTVPALLVALDDPAGDVRYWAMRSLERVAGPECVEAVARRLDDDVVHIRILAMRVLADRGSPTMGNLAKELAGSEHAWQRAAAADAFGALGEAAQLPTVTDLLADADPQVRRAAVVALLRIGSPSGRAALEKALSDDDWEVRLYAAEALARLPGKALRGADRACG